MSNFVVMVLTKETLRSEDWTRFNNPVLNDLHVSELTRFCSAGDFVENTVKNVLSGQGQKGEEQGGQEGSEDKGGFGVGDALSLVGGKKDDDKGGFGIGDAFSLVGGNKEGEKEGEGESAWKSFKIVTLFTC